MVVRAIPSRSRTIADGSLATEDTSIPNFRTLFFATVNSGESNPHAAIYARIEVATPGEYTVFLKEGAVGRDGTGPQGISWVGEFHLPDNRFRETRNTPLLRIVVGNFTGGTRTFGIEAIYDDASLDPERRDVVTERRP